MKKIRPPALALAVLVILTGLSEPLDAQQKSPPPIGETKLPTAVTLQSIPQTRLKFLVATAISSSIVTKKGKEFPLVAKGTGSDTAATGGATCELCDTQAFTQNAPIDLESPDHVKKTNTYPSDPPQRAVVSPPNADWIVQSYRRVITSAGHPYEAGVNSFPAGYSFLTSGNYTSVKATMHSFVASLNIPGLVKADLNTKLDTLISNISSYNVSLSGSHGTVEHTALVRGTGITNTKAAHSWYHGYIDGTLICAPAYLHDQNALIARLKTWVNNVVKRLPVLNTDVPVRDFAR